MTESGSVSGIEVRTAVATDAPALARLMHDEIPWGRLRDFGHYFLTLLHRAFCTSAHAVCVVAHQDGTVVGYCAAVVNRNRFYAEFAIRRGVAAALAILPHLVSWERVRILWKGIRYRSDPGPAETHSEIAVLAVDRRYAGRGIGSRVLTAAMDLLRARGVSGVRIGTVTEGNQAAIAVYSRYGFTVQATKTFYGDSQVHIMEYRFDRPPA